MSLEQHLRDRGMDPSLYNVQYDDDAITFYLYNLSGQIVGFQQYRPEVLDKKMNDPRLSRYFTYISEGRDGVFGLEVLDHYKGPIFIVEGIFKAAVLHRLGYNSIAVLTSHPKRMKPFFRIMQKTYDLIAIGDPDSAGQKLVNTIGKGLCSPKDLDEMSDAEVKFLVYSILDL
jgi:DNA primase